jgi:dTDP-4-amino-4,6-dideoxygalactose transaminase
MHRQPLFSSFCCVVGRPEGKSRSGEFFGRGVCLPSGSGMTDEELAAVAERVRLAL